MAWTNSTYPGGGVGVWPFAAMSYDGLVIVSSSVETEYSTGYIYISTDSGETWTAKTAPGIQAWRSFAASSTGSKLYAQVYNGYIWSSVDSGATWTEQTGSGVKNWSNICCSSDGATVYAVESNGLCYKSTDSGATWAATDSTASSCRSVACSADGSVVLAGGSLTNDLYFSADGGTSWTVTLTGNDYISVAMDATGTNMVAVEVIGDVFVSNDGGDNWTNVTNSPQTNAYNAFVSADGSFMFVNYDAGLYSYDSGATWMAFGDAITYITSSKTDGSLSLGTNTFSEFWYLYSGEFPQLSIIFITPDQGPTVGGTPVTITGTGFDPAATAAIDGNDLTDLVVVDDTTITGITPAGTAGAVDVTVTNP